jgi:hypothetical protein
MYMGSETRSDRFAYFFVICNITIAWRPSCIRAFGAGNCRLCLLSGDSDSVDERTIDEFISFFKLIGNPIICFRRPNFE